jgi:hypothetical protein
LQPDRPEVCRFWLHALLSTFQPPSGTNEEGLQIVCMHLARFLFFYTGHALPPHLRRKLTRDTEAHRMRLEVAAVVCMAPSTPEHHLDGDRISVECTTAAVRTLRYVLQRDEKVLETSAGEMRMDTHTTKRALTLRAQLSRALLMGHRHNFEYRGGPTQPEMYVPEVAKLVIAMAVRGAGLVSTAFGWLMARDECQRLLAGWMDKSWWKLDNADNIHVALNSGFTSHRLKGHSLERLSEAKRKMYARSHSFGEVPARSFVAGACGNVAMTALLKRLQALEPTGRAAVLVLSMDVHPQELYNWYEWLFEIEKAGNAWGLREQEVAFAAVAGGPLQRIFDIFMGSSIMYDMWHIRVRHVLDLAK